MVRTYIVAVDGSPMAWKAMELAATIAGTTDAALVLAHVIPIEPVPPGLEKWGEVEGVSPDEARARVRAGRTIGDNITREAETRAKELGLENVSTKVIEGDVATHLVELAQDINADMIFLGSRGLSDLQGLFLGSVSHKVSNLAPCTCVLVR
jgi:nucleotide-binding universal stress UspA family protein